MINLCFGMRTINVTQLPGGSYSHPNMAMDLAGEDAGIDYWWAQGRWKVVGFFGSAGTILFTHVDREGNPEPVYCADGIQRLVTLALTHSGNRYVQRPEIGTIYENLAPMYEEGTQGNATGNHIHLEVASGIHTTKIWDDQMRVWRMPNELNPVRTIFINKGFSRILNTAGAAFSFCDQLERVEGDEDMRTLPIGHSVVSLDGAAVHVVRPPEDYQMMMLSPSKEPRNTALSYINHIGIQGFDVFATVNCNYFQMRHDQADPYGQHYGVEYSDVNDFAPKQKEWLCFYETVSGEDNFCWSSDFWLTRAQCRWACSPYSVVIHNGQRINWRSGAAGNKEDTPNTQTMAFKVESVWCFAVAESKVLPSQMAGLASEYGAAEAFLLDSGGSSQLIYNGDDPGRHIYHGQKIVYSGRMIPNVLALVRKKKDTDPAPEPDDSEIQQLKDKIDKLEKENAVLRASKIELLNRIDQATMILAGEETK